MPSSAPAWEASPSKLVERLLRWGPRRVSPWSAGAPVALTQIADLLDAWDGRGMDDPVVKDHLTIAGLQVNSAQTPAGEYVIHLRLTSREGDSGRTKNIDLAMRPEEAERLKHSLEDVLAAIRAPLN